MAKFVPCDRNQPFLLPPNMLDWLPEDDLAHFVIEAVERVDRSKFQVNQRGTGSGPVPSAHAAVVVDLLLRRRVGERRACFSVRE